MRRMSFRTRLVIMIAGVFVAAGAGLLAVQYFVVQQLFSSAITMTQASCIPSGVFTLGDSADLTQTTGPSGAQDFSEVQPLTDGTITGCAYYADAALSVQAATPLASTSLASTVPVEAVGGAVLQQSTFLADEVGSGLLLWSVVVLVAFTGVAAIIAHWLARRSLGRIGEVTATARDISAHDLGRRLDLPGPDDEIKELGDTIDGMLDRLQSAFTAQDRFVANASHELRTPLTTTRTALEIPLEQGSVPAELQPNVQRALRATEQSERLITALLALARARTGLDEVESIELDALVQSEIDELDAQGIVVHTSLRELTIEGDTVLMARAVRNLLENAVRHNVPDGEVWVRSRRERGRAIVEVENTGEPITPATVALLTEPFYRGDASRTSAGPDGTGLGLAIVQSIAKTHGGEVRLRARKGGGLIAAIVLPL